MLLFEEHINEIVHSQGSCLSILVPGNFIARSLNLYYLLIHYKYMFFKLMDL